MGPEILDGIVLKALRLWKGPPPAGGASCTVYQRSHFREVLRSSHKDFLCASCAGCAFSTHSPLCLSTDIVHFLEMGKLMLTNVATHPVVSGGHRCEPRLHTRVLTRFHGNFRGMWENIWLLHIYIIFTNTVYLWYIILILPMQV